MKKIIFLLLMSVIVFGIAMADSPAHPPGEVTLAVLSENSIESYAVNSDTVLVWSLSIEKTNQFQSFMVLYNGLTKELAKERSVSLFKYGIGYYLRC